MKVLGTVAWRRGECAPGRESGVHEGQDSEEEVLIKEQELLASLWRREVRHAELPSHPAGSEPCFLGQFL